MTEKTHLKFVKSENMFEDPNLKMMNARHIGYMSLKDIDEELERLSTELVASGKSARLGVAIHYGNVNMWTPALLFNAGEATKYFDKEYSDRKGFHLYSENAIDAVEFYIINNEGDAHNDKSHLKAVKGTDQHKPSFNKKDDKRVTINSFKDPDESDDEVLVKKKKANKK
jgi:hypothetical protein